MGFPLSPDTVERLLPFIRHTLPWRVVLDDTGGPFTGWPSIEANEEYDSAIIHRAGFSQEHWHGLSQRDAIAAARLICALVNSLVDRENA